MLDVLTINVGAAARGRAEALLRWLAARPEDVFLLTETSAGDGTAYLLDQFRRAGFTVVKTPDDGERGAALISRIPVIEEQLAAFGKVSIPGRIAAAVQTRHQRLTDHAAVTVSLRADAERLKTGDPIEEDPPSLF